MASPREMMRVELEKLHAPLDMLNALSRCLTDAPEELDIRRSLAALRCRVFLLEEQLGDATAAESDLADQPSSSALLTESEQVLGTS